jgi:phosphonate transport system substrate-binding protein
MKKLLVLSLVLLLAACALPRAEPLRYVIIPSEGSTRPQEQFAPFIEHLSGELGQEVVLVLVPDYAAAVEAMKYGHADIARFGAFSYIMATQEAGVEAVAVGVKANTGEPEYYALIVARADRGVTDLNGASFAFSDVGSTSGYLAPVTYFDQAGIEPGEVFFSGSHNASIEAVKNGTVDAAGVADNRYITALEEGVIAEGEFEILWKSDPIPNAPIAVRGDLDPRLKDRIQQAFLNAPGELVEGLGVNEIGYVEVEDGDYDIIRSMQETKDGN